nr:hypothetical protein [Tanacetum cinerariifolium]
MIVELLKEERNRRYQDSPLMMVVKEIVSRLLEEEGLSHFRKERHHLTRKRCFETERKDWNEKIHHHFHQWNHPMDEMKVDDLEWRRMS